MSDLVEIQIVGFLAHRLIIEYNMDNFKCHTSGRIESGINKTCLRSYLKVDAIVQMEFYANLICMIMSIQTAIMI